MLVSVTFAHVAGSAGRVISEEEGSNRLASSSTLGWRLRGSACVWLWVMFKCYNLDCYNHDCIFR